MKLTIRQEKFAQEYMLDGNASRAYRAAYPKSQKWIENSVYSVSSQMLAKPKVKQRVQQLQAENKKKYEVTLASIVVELTDIIADAKLAKQFAPAISGVVKKAELFGLFEKHNKQLSGTISDISADDLLAIIRG